MMKKSIFLIISIISIKSCSYPELTKNELVYENDFEKNILEGIDGGSISNYNGSNVIGNFNNDGFTLNLNNLENHSFVYISFDLYIHGSWDGNFNGFNEKDHGFEDQPDLWVMELRPEMTNYQDIDFQQFKTTFSNSPCWPNYCLRQSYPNSFPFSNNPKTGSAEMNMTENCISEGWNNVKTTKYQIEKGFNHKGNALVVRFYDELFQPNAIDDFGQSVEKCDESWSMDNLKVRIISYD